MQRPRLCAELVDQREHIAVILTQQFPQVARARRLAKLRRRATGGKGPVNLRVQLRPVRDHHKGPVPLEFSEHLLREEHHRVTLPTSLGLPENSNSILRIRTLTPGPSPRGIGEFFGDLHQHNLGFMKNCCVLETNHLQLLRAQIRIPLVVVVLRFIGIVDLAIAFHDEPYFVAVEVADIIAELVLPPKLYSRDLTISQ